MGQGITCYTIVLDYTIRWTSQWL